MGDKKNVPVTILMPAYNEEQAIGETIRKVKELYPDFVLWRRIRHRILSVGII